jgi:hypothetical protein
MSINYIKDTSEFWKARLKSREALGKYFASLPFSKKIDIIEKMRANHDAMRNAKKTELR